MNIIRLAALLGAFIAAASFCVTPNAAAQQKYTISQAPNANSQYLREYSIEVDDVPGHRLRVYEIRQPGKFKGMRGQVRGSGVRVPGATTLNVEWKSEYWMED